MRISLYINEPNIIKAMLIIYSKWKVSFFYNIDNIQTVRILGFIILEHSAADDSLITYKIDKCNPKDVKTN